MAALTKAQVDAIVHGQIRERDFLAQVKSLARLLHWRTYHTRDSRGSDPGYPDLVVVRAGVMHAIELKTMRGRVTPTQREWLDAIGSVRRVTADVYRPSDWPRIEALLKGDIE